MTNQSDKAQALLDHLSNLLSHGWLYYFCAKSLDTAYAKHEIICSQFFFMGCFYACLNESILALSKIMIDNADSISIYYLLEFAHGNTEAFPYVNSVDLLKSIDNHKNDLGKFAGLEKKIRFQRDKTIAHFDRKHINNPQDILKNPDLNMNEIEECYRGVHRIINTFMAYKSETELFLGNIEEEVPNDLNYLLSLIKK